MSDLGVLKRSGIGRFRSNSPGNHKTLNKTFYYKPKLNFNNRNNQTVYNTSNESDTTKHLKNTWDNTTNTQEDDLNNETIHAVGTVGLVLDRTLVEVENEHVCLSGRRLEEFRTRHCPFYLRQMCVNSSRCDMSHSETWPRRNPAHFRYDYKLCPNIQFFRHGNKMQLQGKCSYGRRCKFSHSKEEQLYHPDLYKTRYCVNYPNCKGYYCPFAHSKEELRTINHYSHGNTQFSQSQVGGQFTNEKYGTEYGTEFGTEFGTEYGKEFGTVGTLNYTLEKVDQDEEVIKELAIVDESVEKETDTNSTCSNTAEESTNFSPESPKSLSDSTKSLLESPKSAVESPDCSRDQGSLSPDLRDFTSDLTHLSQELRELSGNIQLSELKEEEEDYNWFEDVIKSGLSLLDQEEKGEKRCQICSGCLDRQNGTEVPLESDHFSKQYQDLFKLWDKDF